MIKYFAYLDQMQKLNKNDIIQKNCYMKLQYLLD